MTTSVPVKVAVIGAEGRMGRAVCAAVEAAADLELGPRVDVGDDVEAVADADVAVVFSTPDVAVDHVLACVRLGVHAVVGTTGWTPERLDRVRAELRPGRRCRRPRGTELRARRGPADALRGPRRPALRVGRDRRAAPSGQGRRAQRDRAAHRRARRRRPPRGRVGAGTRCDLDVPEGARGADVDGVRVHSVRLRGLVAHEEVLLGGPGELLTLRHDSFDRASFMPGVLLGVRRIAARPGLTVGLEHLLEL